MKRLIVFFAFTVAAGFTPPAVTAQTAAIAGAHSRQADARSPISYKVSFPEPEHHWMQVEMTVNGLGAAPLRARMSRSSPGRYAVHEFAKNVFSAEIYNGRGTKLAAERPDVDSWLVSGHDGTVRIVYKVFGDTPDGTYMGVDTTHARMNMPAAFMWVAGQESRAMKITFAPPQGSNWKIATQLFGTADPWTFTAPNLQYFMDSPTELADLVISEFTVQNADGSPVKVRLAAHSDGSQADIDELAKLVQPMVREHMAVFGEFPKYEPGNYTFLLDYVPWGDGDGMEHRNSTMVSTPGLSMRTAQGRSRALSTISHEYFHNWNVERIRPAGLEPFDFTRENVTCCLWLAEGFTQYYGPLLLRRAGLSNQVPTSAAIELITNSGARQLRSAVEMSLHAPFADAGVANDTVDRGRTFISYYTFGAGIALGLDLSLREMSGGKITLDDYMRRLWRDFGKVPASAPGLVARPYTLKDLRAELAALTGNQKFADDFFDKYVEGHDVIDYARLLKLAGYDVRKTNPGKGWAGNVQVRAVPGGLIVGMPLGRDGQPDKLPVAFNAPLYKAGVDFDDTITTIDGAPATMDTWAAITVKAPGTQVQLGVQRRGGAKVTRTLVVEENPAVDIVDAGSLSPAQKAFREAWLSSKVK
jgi:predicted metalloprotease with PDZ domain